MVFDWVNTEGKLVSRRGERGQFTGYLFDPSGAGAGSLVIALHGFPDNPKTYRFQVQQWLAAGHRVFLPFMRGYEAGSVQSDGNYYINAIAEDIVDWLDFLGEEKAHLVGHDWGAVTSWALVAMAPERFYSVTSIAIPFLKRLATGVRRRPIQLRYSWYMSFFQLRGVADWWVDRYDWRFIRYLWEQWSPGWEIPSDIYQSVIETLAQPGVKKAALGYYRCAFKPLTHNGRATTALFQKRATIPVLLITGAQDGCMHTDLFDEITRAEDFSAGFQIERIQNAGHFVQLEAPDQVSTLTLAHFNQHEV